METAVACSTNFKSSAQASFVFQPVIMPAELKEHIIFFVNRVRGN